VKIKSNVSPLRLLKRGQEFVHVEEIDHLPRGMRGIYVLYKHHPKGRRFDVVYVGMAADGSIRGRLRSHRTKKRDLWTHCSAFEVWDNITPAEVKELEGIFRHIYRKDSRAAELNIQRSFGRMKKLPRIFPRGR
jgi:hypothetical protein